MPEARPRSALDVLYSASPLVLSTANTVLAGDRVFTGAQPDDFAAAGLLTSGPRVCLLGLGFGAAIRTIASFLPDARITAVDSDRLGGSLCVELYREYFPRLRFDFRPLDALEFLRNDTDSTVFDVICVDLYLPTGYADLLFRNEFWRAVRHRLAPAGVALVNAGGLPAHLRPLEPPSPQAALLGLVSQHWPRPRYLVNKRNWTIVLESMPADGTEIADRALRASQFTGTDRAIMSLLPVRLRAAPHIGELPVVELESVTRQQIDAEIEARWPRFEASLRAVVEARGESGVDARPEAIAVDPRNGPGVLRYLLSANRIEADFFATAASSLAMAGEPGVGWFGRWLCDQVEWLYEAKPEWLLTTALPQALAMVACPVAPRWPWARRLTRLAVELAEHAWATDPAS